MNKKLKILSASIMLAGALGVSNQASATLYVIDDFSVNQGPVIDDIADSTPVTNSISQRTITVDQILNPGSTSLDSSAEAVLGDFYVSNASGTNSIVDIAWTLATNALPSASTAAAFFLDVVASDGNPTNLDFYFNPGSGSTLLASFAIPANTTAQQLNFNLTTAQIATVSGGGVLDLRLSGATGWDSQISTIGFNDTPPGTNVPEANTLALMGLGLAGFAASRRKKQA